MSTPYVSMEYPKNPDAYKVFNIDGIKVFMDKHARVKNKYVTITLSNFILFKTIEVNGLQITS